MDTVTSGVLSAIGGAAILQIGTYLVGSRKAKGDEKAAVIAADAIKEKALLEAEGIREKARLDAAALVEVARITSESQKANAAIDLQSKMLSEMVARMNTMTVQMEEQRKLRYEAEEEEHAFELKMIDRDVTVAKLQITIDTKLAEWQAEIQKLHDEKMEVRRELDAIKEQEKRCQGEVAELRRELNALKLHSDEPISAVPAVTTEPLDGAYLIEKIAAAEPVAAVSVS